MARLRGPTAIAGRLGPERRARPSGLDLDEDQRRAVERDQVDLAAHLGRADVAGDDPPARPLERGGDQLFGGSPELLARGGHRRRPLGPAPRARRAPIGPSRSTIGAPSARRAPLRSPVLAVARTFALLGVEAREVRVEVDVARGAAVVRPRRAARRGGARVARAGAGGAGQLRLRVSRSSGSPRTWRPPTCARRGRASTSRSPPRSSPPPASSPSGRLPTSRWPASSPSTARSARSPGRWRWPRRRAGGDPDRGRAACRGPGGGARGGRRCGPGRAAGAASRARRRGRAARPEPADARPRTAPRQPDLADLRGQPGLRRALEVAAAGGHSLLISGPPGAGKSMAARRLPSILPPLGPAGGDRGRPGRERLRSPGRRRGGAAGARSGRRTTRSRPPG